MSKMVTLATQLAADLSATISPGSVLAASRAAAGQPKPKGMAPAT